MKQTEDMSAGINGLPDGSQERSASDPRLARAMVEYRALLAAGEKPDHEEFLARYPELAGALADCLAGLDFLHAAASELSTPRADGAPAAGLNAGAALGDFRIVREVGRGGMGVVYEAEQISLGRRVALKVLPLAATLDARQMQRFHNEARAAASLHHEHIAPVHAVGCERGMHFYAMQFINGQTLAEWIEQQRTPSGVPSEPTADYQSPMDDGSSGGSAAVTPPPAAAATSGPVRDAASFRRIAEWGMQAAEALEYAHSIGIVHRDIKPANLMVDGQGKLWLTDFGLARTAGDSGLTMTGDLLGTLRYMSPEQALAKHGLVDHRTDVYSLGVTLYELLTLHPAVEGKDRQEILRRIAFEESAVPRSSNRAIPVELETIVLKAMEKRPQDRYATAKELADDLRRFLDDRPVLARRPSLAQRVGRWARRNRALVGSLAAGLLLAVVALGGSIGWVVRDRSTRQAVVAARVTDALDESERLYRAGKVPEALKVAQRAEGLLATGPADEALVSRVQERVEDLQMVLKLEEVVVAPPSKQGAEYEQLFRRYGIDLAAQPTEEIAARIRNSFIVIDLVGMLDQMAILFSFPGATQTDLPPQKLMAVARQVDPDPWRDRVRQAIERGGRAPLAELARTADIDQLPPVLLRTIGFGVGHVTPPLEQASASLAREFLRRALQRYPSDLCLNKLLADHLQFCAPQDWKEAAGYLRILVALRPNSVEINWRLGEVMQQSRQYDDSILYFRKSIEVDPDFFRGYLNIALSLAHKGQMDEADVWLHKAIDLKHTDCDSHFGVAQVFYYIGRWDDAITECREAIRLSKSQSGNGHELLALALQKKGRYEEAIAAFEESIRREKGQEPYHLNSFAWLLATVSDPKYRDPPRAVELAKKAVELAPGQAVFWNTLGSAHYSAGDWKAAIAAYRESLRIDKDFAVAHYNLGNALQNKGQLEAAIAEYREAIRLKKDYSLAHNDLAWLLATAADAKYRDPPRAVELAKKAVELAPKQGAYWNTLGVAHYRAGDWKAAIEALKKSDELYQGNLLSYNAFFLAMAHWQLGEKDQARQWYGKAVQWMDKNEPQDEELKRSLAEAEELLGLKNVKTAKEKPVTKP